MNNNDNNRNSKFKNSNWDTTKKSHFINIPIAFNDESFINEYKIFMSTIENYNLYRISPHLFQKPYKLHMTVCTLNIGEDQNKIDKVHNAMLSINTAIKEISNDGVTFNFDKYDVLGSEKNARVVYAEMKQDENYDKLCKIIDLIIKTLLNEKLIGDEELNQNFVEYDNNTKIYKIKLHLTLLNVLFWNKILKKQKFNPIDTIDVTELLSAIQGKLILPSTKITQINFSRMREDKKTEMYELLNGYQL